MQRMHRTRRFVVASITTLGVLAGTSAVHADTPTAQSARASRFHALPAPASLDLSNLPSHADPDSLVGAIVQLAGDSALTKSAASDQRIDPAAAKQEVLNGQQAISAQLQAAGATIEGNITTVLNAVRVRVKVRDLRALANIAGVTQVHVSRLVHRDNANSNALTGVNAVWEDLGVSGQGMTVAVIDTGIDYYHADFAGVGGQAAFEADDSNVIELGSFPTDKVNAGYDFVGDAYDPDSEIPANTVPTPDPDPLDCDGHGTHVSGTVAGDGVLADGSTYTGPYDATTMSNEFQVAPGVAPQAALQMYKVFGCTGAVEDSIIIGAIDMAVANGADVINMSLGSDLGLADSIESQAIDAATAAGVLVVASAGNAGPGAYVVGAPSTTNSVLSVAAVDAVPTVPTVAVTGAVTTNAQNSNTFEFTAPVTGELVDVGLGCDLDAFAPAAGKIAITTRGECDRVARAILGTQAGALGVIFINTSPGLPPLEGPIPGATVPFVGVTPEDGLLFQAAEGQSVTLEAGPDAANPGYRSNASFTSAGPRSGDSALKPDIAAPGVSVLSAASGTGTGGRLESGTSMSSPHTAGIAALVRQTHPDWDPAAIKAAMMSTATPEGIVDYSARSSGAGLVDARSAVDTTAFISTADGLDNLSFGYEDVEHHLTSRRMFTINNTSDQAITYDLDSAIDDAGTGATLNVQPSAVTVPAGQSRNIWVVLRIDDPSAVPSAFDDDGGALAAIDGFVVAQPREDAVGVHRLVTPLLMVPGSVSNVRATPVRDWDRPSHIPPAPHRIKLYNSGNHAGDADFYQWAISDNIGDSPDPLVPDIRSVGVQQFPFDEAGPLLVFAINTAAIANTQSVYEFDIAIDTNGDGEPEFTLIIADNGLLTAGTIDGTMASALIDSKGNLVSLFGASAPANGSIVEGAVPAAALGALGLFSFAVAGFTVMVPDVEPDVTGLGAYDSTNPAVHAADPTDPSVDFPFISLDPKGYVPVEVSVDRSAAHAQNAIGWMIVTTDDAAGAKEANLVSLRP